MTLSHAFSRLDPMQILVVGDLLLDTYTFGSAKRISPEAPVAVVHAHATDQKPGGAGNVALGLKALGAKVRLLGRIGDKEGSIVKKLLVNSDIETTYLYEEPGHQTAVKNRIMAGSHQICRVDFEVIEPLTKPTETKIIQSLSKILDGVDAIAISDYAKGLLTPKLLKALILKAEELGIEVLVDPKGNDYSKYVGANIIKPNMSEALSASNLDAHASIEEIAAELFLQTKCEELIVTRSAEGISLFNQERGHQNFSAQVRQVTDVTGAGDTVLAILTLAKASGLSTADACQLANLAAGIAVERLGCAEVTLADLAERLIEHHLEGKIFDGAHFFALKQVLREKPFTMLSLTSDVIISPELLKVLTQYGSELVVYVDSKKPRPEVMHLLGELQTVRYVIPATFGLSTCASELKPTKLYEFNGEELIALGELAKI